MTDTEHSQVLGSGQRFGSHSGDDHVLCNAQQIIKTILRTLQNSRRQPITHSTIPRCPQAQGDDPGSR